MTTIDPAIEPELRTPPPRIIRPRARERFLRWFFIVLSIIAPGGMVAYAYLAQQDWNAFAAQIQDPDGHLWMILVQPPDWVQ